jgi:condensin complex subunit 1
MKVETIHDTDMAIDSTTITDDIPENILDSSGNENNSLTPDMELKQLHGLLHYYKDALKFSVQIQNAAPQIFTLLSSTTKSEIVAAMKFIYIAHQFDMECAQEGILKMVHKIWDKDTNDKETGSIRDHLVQTFYSIYFEPAEPSPEPICTSLIQLLFFDVSLVGRMDLAQLTSLEQLLFTMSSMEKIPSYLTAVLWSRFSIDHILHRFAFEKRLSET